ncbi:unnamed protein product (macronuclear) [Paramecium tetraurelia]|uniref:Ras-GAP domain-containing protein n=1 Tax=Paramecium tetraurelia TaxID=5888 RepID=A0D446_PARTE|nr:uncharacterized protein GSPATT00013279001 [Paramecium tetraurelia]CAK77813.1 unnamed protein product [Paramecium tetraurelia]|eukprot:XP_001445210.1 hypothetical protein (macronuclear) [Paramecium tetraurelia strain d4-2]
MISRKNSKYESRRQMLYDLSKKAELQEVTQTVLDDMEDLQYLYKSYSQKYFDRKTVEILGDDPILKGQKLMFMILNRDNSDSKERIRKSLLNLHCSNSIFPEIIHFIKVDNQSIQIKYCSELERELFKYDQEKQDRTEAYNKMEESSDQTIILIHLLCLKHSISNQQDFLQYFNTSKDYQKIKDLHARCQELDFDYLEKNTQSIVHIIAEFYQLFSTYCQMIKPRQEKCTKLIFRVLLQLLLYQNIVIPELLRFMKIIRNSSLQNVQQYCGIIILKPTITLLTQMSQIPQISNQVELLKIEQINFNSNLPNYEQFYLQVLTHFPFILQINAHQVLVNYLEKLTQNYNKHIEVLEEIYQNTEFSQLMEQIDKICGAQIKSIINSDENSEDEFEEQGTNVLQIGTMLFRLREKVFQNNHSAKLKQINDLIEKFKKFLQHEIEHERSFPQLLKYINCNKNDLWIDISDNYDQELLEDPRFSDFLQKCDNNEIQVDFEKGENENEILENQIKLIYHQREQSLDQLKQLNGNLRCDQLMKDLQKSELQHKEYLVKLLVCIQYQIYL